MLRTDSVAPVTKTFCVFPNFKCADAELCPTDFCRGPVGAISPGSGAMWQNCDAKPLGHVTALLRGYSTSFLNSATTVSLLLSSMTDAVSRCIFYPSHFAKVNNYTQKENTRFKKNKTVKKKKKVDKLKRAFEEWDNKHRYSILS